MTIQLIDVSFRYMTQPSDEYAVRSLNCEIEDGRFVAITGNSGAGKSTFCRLLAGQIPHFYQGEFSGTVTVDGVDTSTMSLGELATTVGFVFDNPYDQLTGAAMTVEEEVAFALENMGVAREEMGNRVSEALEAVGIADLGDRDPYELSGGQCQRVAIASVLAIKPNVLVLKNPTSQLDPKGTEEVLEVVARMNNEGLTVVLATQDIEAAVEYLDRILVFEAGEISTDGLPEDVINATADSDLPLNVPESARLGFELRRRGLIDDSTPVPLTSDDAVNELRQFISDYELSSETASPVSTPSISIPDGERNKLALESVGYTYDGGVHALNEVSLSFDEGCVCIMGQNGAGKSTLLKTLNGLLEPTEGDVYVCGENTKEHRTAQLAASVALSFQNPNDQVFQSTVEKEIRFGPTNLGYSDERINELTESALTQFELLNDRDENPANLNYPRKKLVSVASVVAMDTPIVVLDEPTGGQDDTGRRIIGQAVDRLVTSGKLVVVVSHDPLFAAHHADRVVVLHDGEVALNGATRETLTQTAALSEASVKPPTCAQIGDQLGLTDVLTVESLADAVQERCVSVDNDRSA